MCTSAPLVSAKAFCKLNASSALCALPLDVFVLLLRFASAFCFDFVELALGDFDACAFFFAGVFFELAFLVDVFAFAPVFSFAFFAEVDVAFLVSLVCVFFGASAFLAFVFEVFFEEALFFTEAFFFAGAFFVAEAFFVAAFAFAVADF